MAIARVCAQCGIDLARRRPEREQRYGLRLTVCECGWATAHCMHPLWKQWRQFRRLFRAALAMALQLMMIVLLLTLWWFASRHAADLFVRVPLESLLKDHRAFVVYAGVVLPVITGAWLRFGLSHWRMSMQWVGWWLLVTGWITLVMLGLPWRDELLIRAGYEERFPYAVSFGPQDVAFWSLVMVAVSAMTVISLAGAPLGRAIMMSYARHRANRWSRRRRRLRKRGMST